MARHYFDYASAAALRPEVIEQINHVLPYLGADAGRLHSEAHILRDLIEQSREIVASFFSTSHQRVIFTSGLSESIAMATYGVLERSQERRVGLSGLERSAVATSAEQFGEVCSLEATEAGALDLHQLDEELALGLGLLWCQLANHETGIIQPLAEVAERAEAFATPLACDLSGALPYLLPELEADIFVLGAEAFGAPAGTGVLILRDPLRLEPLATGGSQERARRAGLENALGIIALAAALETLSPTRRRDEAKHLLELRQQIEEGFCAIDGVTLIDGGESERVSQTSCFTIAGVEAEPVLIGLERQGFAVHSGSACASESLEASPVLEAMGVDARHGLRISTGWDSSPEGVAGLIAAFGATVSQLRSLRS